MGPPRFVHLVRIGSLASASNIVFPQSFSSEGVFPLDICQFAFFGHFFHLEPVAYVQLIDQLSAPPPIASGWVWGGGAAAGFRVAETMMAIFKDNRTLLEQMKEDVLNCFVRSLPLLPRGSQQASFFLRR